MSETVESDSEPAPLHPETLTESYPWIRYVETLPANPHPEDYKIETTLGVVEMDEHVHALENHGYSVERIASNAPKGQRLYATI